MLELVAGDLNRRAEDVRETAEEVPLLDRKQERDAVRLGDLDERCGCVKFARVGAREEGDEGDLSLMEASVSCLHGRRWKGDSRRPGRTPTAG